MAILLRQNRHTFSQAKRITAASPHQRWIPKNAAAFDCRKTKAFLQKSGRPISFINRKRISAAV